MSVPSEGLERLQSVTSQDSTLSTNQDQDYDYMTYLEVDDEYLDESDTSEKRQNVNSRITFASMHSEPQSFESPKRRCFMPGQKIHIQVVEVEVPDTSRLLNPNVYVIEIKHGDYEWTIRRRYKHFRHIHEQLILYRARLKIPFPMAKNHQERRKSYHTRKHTLPNFPKTPDPLVDDIEKRKEDLTGYLQQLVRYPQYRNHVEVLKFLEVSNMSFVTQLGGKYKEGMVKKRSGGHKFKMGCLKAIKGCVGGCRCCQVWQVRWLVVKDTFVAYIDPEKGTVRDVLLMDRIFKVYCGKDNTRIRHGLVLSNMNRKLTLTAWTHRKAKEWMMEIDRTAREYATDFTLNNRYDSFAPVRDDIPVKWFVDGATYMSAVADALELAKEEIFITDWWLSPELFMKRPIGEDGAKWRLDVILKRKADEGVKVFVLLYKEMQVALGINSFYSKETLQNLNPHNIKVLRHPDGINLWSHHEKTVIIDQRVAFLGGIDLCYGRWDTPTHRLQDLGSIGEYNAADDVPGTLPVLVDNGGIIASPDDVTPVIVENPTESADSFRPRFGRHSPSSGEPLDGYDEPDITQKKSSSSNVTSATQIRGNNKTVKFTASTVTTTVVEKNNNKSGNISAGDSSVMEGRTMKHKQWSLEKQLSHWSSSAEETSTESEATNDSEFDEDDLEGPEQYRRHQKNRQQKTHPRMSGKPAIKPVPTGPPPPPPVTPGERAKHYSRSESLPADAQLSFNPLSSNKKPSKNKQHLPVIKDSDEQESDSENDVDSDPDSHMGFQKFPNKKQSKSSQYQQPAVFKKDLSPIKEVNNSSMDYMTVPDIVIEPASDTDDDTRSERSDKVQSSSSQDVSHSESQANYSRGNKKKKRRKLPQLPKSDPPKKHVTGYATPYEEPKTSDSREEIVFGSNKIRSYKNAAFDDSNVSDSREQIVFDSKTTSYTNYSAIEGQRRDENYNTPSGEDSLDYPAPLTALDKLGHHNNQNKSGVLLVVNRNLDAISVGEPQSFRDYIKEVNTESKFLPNGLPRVVQDLPRDESGHEEEKELQKQLKKEKKKKRGPANIIGRRNKLTRMKAVEKGESESDSSSDSDNDRRFKDKSKDTHNKKKHHKKKKQKPAAGIETSSSNQLLILNPSSLRPPERQAASYLADEKPSTPRPKKKLAQKAKNFHEKTKERTRDLKQDIRSKFQSKRSRSMGGDLDGGPIENIDFFQKEHEDDIINKLGEEENYKLWIGKDYTNFIFKDFVDLDQPFSDFIDRQATPRMPWHDIGAVVYAKAARDVARHFIQRWNFTKLQKRKDNPNYPLLVPKAYRRVPIPPVAVRDPMVIWSKVQILRSASHWSTGLKYREASIQNAYVDLIKHAKHFIYIENQFFVSIMNDSVVQNNIAGALYERILYAHHRGEIFRVYFVLPLLPAFEGELGTPTGTSIQAVTHWNYTSICRGGKSLLERLVAAGVMDPFEFISFYGLRNYGTLNGNLTSEILYVHSKMMIVDDMQVIIGSANINDRSMIGKRDSEMAVVVEDVQTMDGVLNGKPVKVGKFAHSMRMHLFREHMGLLSKDAAPIDCSDPCIKSFYKGIWMKAAATNTDVHEKVFNCLPSDQVTSFQELKTYQKQEGLVKTDNARAKQLMKKVKGHLVIMPLQFLSKETSLAPSAGTKESLAPTIVWT